MFDPRGPAPMMHAPALKLGGEDGLSAGSAETIRPRPGLMFLFPSLLLPMASLWFQSVLALEIPK